jgi:ring-1,2-phenylacetyl-CoA epoxidase subunit PaaE
MSATTKFYPLTVRDLRRETADTVSIAFSVPSDLQSIFEFAQGQYLTLRATLGGEEVRRSYSICSGVDEGELRVAVKKVAGGVFSTYANDQLQKGDTLEVMPPQGRFFTPLNPAQSKFYVAFAAGSGITPVMSILKTTLVREPLSRFILFFGNRGFDQVIFHEELELLKNRYPDRLSVHHVFSKEMPGSDLFYGRINGEKCRQYARLLFDPKEVDEFFLCGPEDMIFSIKDTLGELQVDTKKIHFELFTTPGSKRTIDPSATVLTRDSFDASVTVIQDGAQFDFQLMSDGSTVLDAAMRAGADLPFSCKGGVCSTCKAKVLEGEVSMEVCYALEPDELEAGYILTCQSHPKSKRLVVSFD